MPPTYNPIKWARALQAISQNGLHFTTDPYDRERYDQLADIAAEMLGALSDRQPAEVRQLLALETGYATPKVDVRALILKEGQVLLVREVADGGRWTLPGGWADVNETPSQAIAREVLEETGFVVEVRQLLAVYDREKQGHSPPYAAHIYKLFFHCHIIGGHPTPNLEASEIAFFDPAALPELSVARVLPHQIIDFATMIAKGDTTTRFD